MEGVTLRTASIKPTARGVILNFEGRAQIPSWTKREKHLHIVLFEMSRIKGKRGVWIKLPIELVNLIEPVVKEGFYYHHAEPKHLMLVRWIPETANTLPANESHRVGIGAFVMNENGEVLVVQEKSEKFQGTGIWKFPTGVVDEGEDICDAAVREVKEEIGIDTKFMEVLAFRHEIIGNPLVELSTGDDLRRAAGYGDEKLSTVVVGGSVLCDACLDGNSPLPSHPIPSHPIPGASMAVSCHTSRKTCESDWVRGITDEYGDFLIDLPSHLHAIPNMEKRCIVGILQLPKSSPCHHAFTGEHRGIKFSSVENGFRTYTAHEIHLTPKYSRACMNKQSRGKLMVHTF